LIEVFLADIGLAIVRHRHAQEALLLEGFGH
jgi:hypothetical protein